MKNSTFLRNLWLWVLLLAAGSVSAQVTAQEAFENAVKNASSGDVPKFGGIHKRKNLQVL